MLNKFILAVCIVIFLVAWIGFPDIIKCPYKNKTGEPCVFCGTLTSFSYFVHGEVYKAWQSNPAGVFSAVILMVIFVIVLFRIFYKHNE